MALPIFSKCCRLIGLGLLCAFTLCVQLAWAAEPTAPKRESRIEENFKKFDKDGDGKLSKQEFPKAKNFTVADANHDGFVTLDEMKLFAGKQKQPATIEKRFKQMDKNGDGSITLDEIKPPNEKPNQPVAIADRFKKMDKDGDGKLSPKEIPNAKKFAAVDANKDGSISLDELTQFTEMQKPPLSAEERFKKMDKNGDGSVTLEEMKQLNQRPPKPQITVEERFKQQDKNGDEKLSPEEFPNAKGFKKADANNDGFVTLDEMKAFRMQEDNRTNK